jgi:hypothetical protein
VLSRNVEDEEAKANYWAVQLQPQWVVTPGKQTNKHFLVHTSLLKILFSISWFLNSGALYV